MVAGGIERPQTQNHVTDLSQSVAPVAPYDKARSTDPMRDPVTRSGDVPHHLVVAMAVELSDLSFELLAIAVYRGKWGIPFTPVSLGDSLGGWKTRKILPLGLITPGRFKRLTSGSAATLHAANISGACAGRGGSYARIAGGPASRG